MSDTSVTTEAPTIPSPPPPTPMPNDAAARSPTGEILEPSQIKPTTETKPTTEAPAPTSTPDDKKPTTPAAAPEAYEFKPPEGYTLDAKLVEQVTPLFKEMGLTQDQAQKLFDVHANALIEAAKGPQATYESLRSDWKAQVDADPDFKSAVSGGKTGLDAVKLDIGRALAAFGDAKLIAEFKDAMNLTGVGDNPAFIKGMWKLAAFVTEGKHVEGNNPSPHGQRPPGTPDRPTGAKALYPNLS